MGGKPRFDLHRRRAELLPGEEEGHVDAVGQDSCCTVPSRAGMAAIQRWVALGQGVALPAPGVSRCSSLAVFQSVFQSRVPV